MAAGTIYPDFPGKGAEKGWYRYNDSDRYWTGSEFRYSGEGRYNVAAHLGDFITRDRSLSPEAQARSDAQQRFNDGTATDADRALLRGERSSGSNSSSNNSGSTSNAFTSGDGGTGIELCLMVVRFINRLGAMLFTTEKLDKASLNTQKIHDTQTYPNGFAHPERWKRLRSPVVPPPLPLNQRATVEIAHE